LHEVGKLQQIMGAKSHEYVLLKHEYDLAAAAKVSNN
jgi:hypothetical protein